MSSVRCWPSTCQKRKWLARFKKFFQKDMTRIIKNKLRLTSVKSWKRLVKAVMRMYKKLSVLSCQTRQYYGVAWSNLGLISLNAHPKKPCLTHNISSRHLNFMIANLIGGVGTNEIYFGVRSSVLYNGSCPPIARWILRRDFIIG